jgi:hypothetical protein
MNCHLSGKIYGFSENLPRCQALSADQLSHIIWRGIGNSSFSVLPFSSSSDLAAHSPRYLGNAPETWSNDACPWWVGIAGTKITFPSHF